MLHKSHTKKTQLKQISYSFNLEILSYKYATLKN